MAVTQSDLATLHEAIAEELADQPCVIAERTFTWRETTERTRRLAAVLRAHGLGRRRPGAATPAWETGQDHLGVYLHNGSEYLESVLGAHKASLAPFNINYRYTSDELAYLLRDARADALVYGERFTPVLAEALTGLDHRPLLLCVADGSGHPLLDGAIDYEVALAAADPADGVPETSADDRHLLYTGGTTGMPRGVIWRVGDMLSGPMGVREGRLSRGRALPAPPLMHGAGIGFAFGGWLGGATVVIQPNPERFDAATLWETVERQGVTSLMIVGDAFGTPLVEDLERSARKLPELRLIVNSGAVLREETKARLRELLPHVRLADVLGSSETGLHARRGSGGGNRFESRGNAIVLDETRTRLLVPGEPEVGWLAQGGSIPLGYLGDPEKTAATFVTVDGRRFSVPGERARLLADGIEFLGRDATTINTGGEKVFAEEVEAVLRAVPGVLDALVVGRPSERWGQEIVALYHPSEEGVAAAELARGCREVLAGYKVPKAFVRVDEVRRQANGKVDYAWARQMIKETE
ncbi:AMP-binding protein [Nonomuraea sp. NPDC050556]|uniref:AMP-binding protein n=1 Tax=Nonomuraea sp. NPDC050556 TaxID=3364369 RepID=UPI0037B86DE3